MWLEQDTSRGGLTQAQIHGRLAAAEDNYDKWGFDRGTTPNGAELYGTLFASAPLEWERIGAFQDVTMRLLAEWLLQVCARASTPKVATSPSPAASSSVAPGTGAPSSVTPREIEIAMAASEMPARPLEIAPRLSETAPRPGASELEIAMAASLRRRSTAQLLEVQRRCIDCSDTVAIVAVLGADRTPPTRLPALERVPTSPAASSTHRSDSMPPPAALLRARASLARGVQYG